MKIKIYGRCLLMSLIALSACASMKPKTLFEKKRAPLDTGEYATTSTSPSASLYQPGQGGMFEDRRARQVGDILIIHIDEAASAAQDASTALEPSDLNAIVAACADRYRQAGRPVTFAHGDIQPKAFGNFGVGGSRAILGGVIDDDACQGG